MKEVFRHLRYGLKHNFNRMKYFFASIKTNELFHNKNIRKSAIIFVLVVFFLTESFAWLYDEYAGQGAILRAGRISHAVTQYDIDGMEIDDDNEVQTILYETNMSNVTVGSKYIEVKNTGTLDMEFSLAFSLEGNYIEPNTSNTPSSDLTQVAGILYYRLYEVTSAVEETNIGAYDSKLEAYAAANQPSSSMQSDTGIPVRNMTLLNNLMKIDTVAAAEEGETSSKIYRFDYGMYSGVNTGLYSNSSLSIHINAYSSQVGVISAENREGQIWEVQNETQLRDVLNSTIAGDTIKLMDNINLEGSLNITKRVGLDLNEYTLNINQDLIYEFNSMGELVIDASGYGSLDIGGDFILYAPKSDVTIIGSENSYDIVVGGEFTIDVLQSGEEDGLYLDNAQIVKTINGLVPVDINVNSNSRITVGPDVTVGNIIAVEGSTNIEIINNGNITQLNLTNMNLLDTYTKAQIYVYNLGEIYGVLGSYGILLPTNATPYIGPNNGNTLIIKGITSGDITVGGAENFDLGDIQTNQDDVFVVPIEGEDNSYIVYIKSSVDTLQGLLETYFTDIEESDDVQGDIAAIKKLVVWTLNAQYFEAEDFTFANSAAMPVLEYLSLFNARVTDGITNNKIPDNAFRNKLSLKNVILPKTVTEIGANAFSGVSLGAIPPSMDEEFNFVNIPSTVTRIGNNAFDSSLYVKFASAIPPTIGSGVFGENTRLFVLNGSIPLFQEVDGLLDEHIYISANLDDDRRYFVYSANGGLGISYIVNNYLSSAATSLTIPTLIPYQGSSISVTEIGNNSFREMNITNPNGVRLSLPNSIVRINDYAFYNLNLTAVEYFTNVVYIGSYSFTNTKISSVVANRATYVGISAFYNSAVESVQLNNVATIGAYAFANTPNLYEANVGSVSNIGDYAFYNCPQMQRFFFNNSNSILVNNSEELDLTVGTNSLFYNWGLYIDGRLRVYVPDAMTASNKTVLSLYKEKFSANANSIYISGTEIGDYTYYAVPHQLSTYTVRTVTLSGYDGIAVTGYEIISYQGPDISSDLPSTLEVNGVERAVISIGENAYFNSTTDNGYEYSIESSSLINIGKNAFKNFTIGHVVSNTLTTIEDSAFEGSTIHYGFFENLNHLGTRAFYDCADLYRLKLGNVTYVGPKSVANATSLTAVFITNTDRTVNYSADAFDNAGTAMGDRFRMYVPNEVNDDLVSFYKTKFSNVSSYIYPTGTIVGHYRHAVNYDIGEYSVRPITKPDASGTEINQYELIEYHGPDLDNDFVFPSTLSVSSGALEGSAIIQDRNNNNATLSVTMLNVSDLVVTGWEFDISGTDIIGRNGVDFIVGDGIVTFSTSQRVNPGASVTVNYPITSNGGTLPTNATIIEIRPIVEGNSSYEIISVGENAFSHVSSATGTTFNLESDSLLYIGKKAFAGMDSMRHVIFNNVVTIDESAFEGSSITQGSFDNLNLVATNAFKNVNSLYILNLGKVQTMRANSITNAPYLYQVLFDPPNTISLDIASNVFSSIGISTDDRQRFYVNSGITGQNEEYVDVYKAHFPEAYRPYFYSFDAVVGDYTPSGLLDTINIGDYSVKNKTINGTAGYEIVEYHGDAIDSSYSFPTVIDLSGNNLSASVQTSGSWFYNGNYVNSLELVISNSGDDAVTSWKAVIYVPDAGTIVSVSTGANFVSSVNGSLITISSPPENGGVISPNAIVPANGSITRSMNITHSAEAFTPSVSSIGLDVMNNGTPVISIGDYAFGHASFSNQANYNIESSYLLNIGVSAFDGNTAVRNIIANNCTNISNNAFNGAANLVTASFDNLITLGDNAFRDNTNLISINLGTVRSIGKYAFANDTNVARITFNNTEYTNTINLAIGENAFQNFGTNIGTRFRVYVPAGSAGASTMVDAYKDLLPNNMDPYVYEAGYIRGSYIFNGYDIGAYSVRSANIGGSNGWILIEYHGDDIGSSFSFPERIVIGVDDYFVRKVGDRAFSLVNVVSNYNWILNLPTNLVEIGDYAFYQRNVYSLGANIINNIGSHAFEQSTTLRTITFNSVINMGDYAFNGCTNLRTATLGTNVQRLGRYALYNGYATNNLTRININTQVPPEIDESTLPARTPRSFLGYTWYTSSLYVYVPRGYTTPYSNDDYWGLHNIRELGDTYNNFVYEIIDADVDYIKIIDYIGSSNEIVIPATFSISNVTYPVRQIASDAFDGATNSTRITLGQNVMNVGNAFLSGNNYINRINVNNNNPYFRSVSYSLYSKNGDTLIKVPNGMSLSNGRFNINDNTMVIASGAFAGNLRLTNIIIPDTVVAISERAFTGANNLTNVSFESSTPPYLTGFEFLPANAGLNINYPLENGTDNYVNNVFYSWYLIDS